MWAVVNGQADVAKLLLDNGADPNIKSNNVSLDFTHFYKLHLSVLAYLAAHAHAALPYCVKSLQATCATVLA